MLLWLDLFLGLVIFLPNFYFHIQNIHCRKNIIWSQQLTQRSLKKKYDYLRTIRAVTYGSLIFSFIGNKWYKFLHYKVKFPDIPNSHWKNQLLRVSVDQLLFAPISLPFYFGCMTLMEGQSIDVVKRKLADEWWNTLKVNWTIWPLFQTINFSLIPLQHQLLAVNLVAIFWNTFLSYKNSITPSDNEKRIVHYPPVAE